MSFFSRSGNNTPTPPAPSGAYNRIPDYNNSLPSGLRSGARHQPPSTQHNAPPTPYNDPSSAFFERRPQYDRKPPPHSGGDYGVVSAPSEALALTNCLIVHPSDFQQGQHVLVKGAFTLTVRHDNTGKLPPGMIGASLAQRQWIGLSVTGDRVAVEALPSPPHPDAPSYLESLDLEVGFHRRGHEIAEQFSSDEMAKNFLHAFSGIVMSVDEIIVFEFHGQNLKATVKAVSTVDLADEQRRGAPAAGQRSRNLPLGIVMPKTDVTFLKEPGSAIKLKSSAKKAPPNAILAPNFKFEDMGIGGLDNEFSEIFRRAFASRVFPPAIVEKLGIDHVKGILLHGPPGTGKTLIARQIGKMLNAREPKVVNGPEILSKYVGASEENIRKLFSDAEKEYKEKGEDSGLHIIIFDELDAIFKHRGSTNNGTGVGDTVVNQLLSKILSIHTASMRKNQVMEPDVDLAELAAETKNFSGAEIGGLIKSATSFALTRHVKVGTLAGISEDVENLRVNRNDFLNALNDVHPAFGVSEEELAQVIQNGIIHFDTVVDVREILHSGELLVEQVRTSTRTPLVSVLLHGSPGSGKTALGATIAQASEFPFIKLISPDNMVGYTESQKVAAIAKVFADSYKSPLSVVVVDNIERLIDWTPMGARFSNAVLQTLLVLLGRRPPKGRRLLIIATSSQRQILSNIGFSATFDTELEIPSISNLRSLDFVLRQVKLFSSEDELRTVIDSLHVAGYDGRDRLLIGIKKLLSMVEMARQEPDDVAQRLIDALKGLKDPLKELEM
ncbi:hypothetical protein H0H87_001824 [Tephrocybe sp. NHM501043]|nr:hypothetical protein H0H87_001824 [Tephrocybe sp. NHM501043]